MDPITTSVIFLALGKVGTELITEACKDHVKDKIKSVFGDLEKAPEAAKVEEAYRHAMKQAYRACLEMLLKNIQAAGFSDEELKDYAVSLQNFIKDRAVAGELLEAVRKIGRGRDDLPSPSVLRDRWNALDGRKLPSENVWEAVASAFRRQAERGVIASPDLRDILLAETVQQLKELVARQGSVKAEIDLHKYFQRMNKKYYE